MAIVLVGRFDGEVEEEIEQVEVDAVLDFQEVVLPEDYPGDDMPVWEVDEKKRRPGHRRLRRVN